MNIQYIDSLNKNDLAGKRVLVRVDFNVPLYEGKVSDDTRLRASMKTINYLTSNGAKVILMSHLGRPKGERIAKYSLKPVADYLPKLLNRSIQFIENCIGADVQAAVDNMQDGEILLLENLRYHPEEEKNGPEFSKELSNIADIYINDAFGAAHRAHASTAGITEHINQKYAGFLIQKELKELSYLLNNPAKPFTSIVGGSKVSSKIDILKSLIQVSDTVLIGGGMAYTFIKAQGGKIGKSICEDDKLPLAQELLALAKKKNTEIVLPLDNICTIDGFNDKSEIPQIFPSNEIADNYEGLDIGPQSIELFNQKLANAKTVLWNGPVGVFEDDRFAEGSKAIANQLVSIQKAGAQTVIGGGDSAAAVAKFGYSDNDFGHISTGGGASLEYLSGLTLPGIQALN